MSIKLPSRKRMVFGGFLLVLSLLLGGLLGYFLAEQNNTFPPQACTMDAKICPDGSAVGRSGPSCEFDPCPLISQTPSLPNALITDKPVASFIIPTEETTGWKRVRYLDISFLIPQDASCNDDTVCSSVTYPIVYQGVRQPIDANIQIEVKPYLGGSRREEYFISHPDTKNCRPVFIESTFGTVKALQIASDGGWCQGGYTGGIVTVVGNKLVIIGPGLAYDETGTVQRWLVRDTMVSTLTSSD